MNDSVFPQKKSREQRRRERAERLALIELNRRRGEHRGWEVRKSGAIGVWQFVLGGKHGPLPENT